MIILWCLINSSFFFIWFSVSLFLFWFGIMCDTLSSAVRMLIILLVSHFIWKGRHFIVVALSLSQLFHHTKTHILADCLFSTNIYHAAISHHLALRVIHTQYTQTNTDTQTHKHILFKCMNVARISSFFLFFILFFFKNLNAPTRTHVFPPASVIIINMQFNYANLTMENLRFNNFGWAATGPKVPKPYTEQKPSPNHLKSKNWFGCCFFFVGLFCCRVLLHCCDLFFSSVSCA